MSNRTLHDAQQRLDALLGMIAEDGETSAGEVPTDHVQALRNAPLGRADEVRQAHAERRGPPDWSGGPGGPGNGGGQS